MSNLTVTNSINDVKTNLINAGSEKSFNYIIELQKLVAQILTELGRISANDHESIERMKNKFMNASLTNAMLQTDFGRVNRNIGIAAFAITCARLVMPNVDDREILNIVSQQAPNLGGMYTSCLQSEMQKVGAESQLELEKYRTKTAAKQSDGSAKQDFIGLLQAVGENLKSASRANG